MQTEDLIRKYLSAFFIFALGCFLFFGLKEFFAAFLGAIVFYVLFKDMMHKLSVKKKINRSLSAVIIIIITFIIVVLPFSILVGMIFNKATSLADNPEYVKHFIDGITRKLERLPFKVSTKNTGDQISTFITSHIGDVLNSSLNMLGSLLMMYFFLFFLLINTRSLEAKIVYYLPFKRAKIMLFGKELVDQTYSNAIGVPTVAIAQGLFAYGAYLITGVPEAGLWSILTGFASIIPLVGTAIIWLPVAIFHFAENEIWQGVFILLFCSIALGNVDNLIRMIVSKRVGDVHPVVTVLGVIVGLRYFGLPGLVFGPLLISYFMLLMRLYYVEYSQKRARAQTETVQAKKGFITRILQRLI